MHLYADSDCKKNGDKPEDDSGDETGDEPPRHDRTNIYLAVIAVVLVATVTLTSLPSANDGSAMEAQVSVQQAQAALTDLAGVFSGSGTLQSSQAQAITLPSTVKVTAYTVKNGDTVQEGQTIANVDKTSVLKAIYEIQSLIEEMDAEIAQVGSDTLDEEITARADGRVKAIYVEEGESVAAAMYENGAVMLISLGGSMTVVIESSQKLTVGQALTVTLSDKTQVEGKVQQVQEGKITVTTTDDGPAPDDTVSVATQDGTTLGTGTLSISSPMKVTGYFGTVNKVRVEAGDLVETGDTLITLTDTEDLARYQQLLRERQELTQLVSDLSVMYQEGTVKAAASGIVSEIDEDAAVSQLSAAQDSGYYVSNLSSSGSYKLVMLSNPEPSSEPVQETNPTEEGTESTAPPAGTVPPESTTPPEESTAPGGSTPPSGGSTPPSGGSTPPGGTTLPGDGSTPPSGGATPPAQTNTDGTFAGLVTKVTYGALQIRISQTDMTGSTVAAVETMDEALFTSDRQYCPSLSVPVKQYVNGQTVDSSVDAIQAGDKVLIHMEEGTVTQIDFIAGTGASAPSQGTTPGGSQQFPSQGGTSGGSMQMPSSGSNFGTYQQPVTQEEDEEEAVYQVETASLCAITPAETMTVDISVDELDILTLSAGQEAAITLDALPGQSFTGTVKKLNPAGTNEGGSTKYTVTVEVPRTQQMLSGMNASVLIEVSRQASVLTVPAAAIQEDGNRTYVYTALDEKTGQPAKAVDVTTGSSDGTNIQILSGLAEGDAVYYSYADSIIYRFAN